MSSFLGQPSSSKLLGEVHAIFSKKRIFYALRTHVTFVCGGNRRSDLRSRFIQYVNSTKSDVVIILAETAFSDLLSNGTPEFINLAKLEELIATVFDSVVIFPESVGSYAELGYFSHAKGIRKRTLIVNSDRYQSDSFLSLGPIAAIDHDSDYRTTILLNSKPEFKHVVDRLKRYPSERQCRIPFHFKLYKQMNKRDRLFVIAEIVNIFGAITQKGLESVIKTIFGSINRKELNQMVSILCAANLILRDKNNADYLLSHRSPKRFLEYENFQIETLRAKVMQYYQKHDRESFVRLRGIR